jgi:hypothetical protein
MLIVLQVRYAMQEDGGYKIDLGYAKEANAAAAMDDAQI